MKPYAIGPTIEVHLPKSISVEAGALYERFHMDITRNDNIRVGFVQAHRAAVSADALLLPLQLKYTFRRRTAAPFVNAGATLRRLDAFTGKGYYLDFFTRQPLPETHFLIRSGRDLDVALTVGAGVRWRVAIVDISPEIRFLHWTSAYYQPAQNQAMLMLTVSFPAVRH